MNARKLKSGSWQSIVYLGMVDGKKKYVTVTAPTKGECLRLANEAKYEKGDALLRDRYRVGEAVRRYIEIKRSVLSPVTVRGYLGMVRRYIDGSSIDRVYLDALNSAKVQSWISALSAQGLSRKTIQNAYGLFVSAVRLFAPEKQFIITFPQGSRYDGYVPSTEEVMRVLEYAKVRCPVLYRAMLLAAFGTLRRGEIVTVTADDLNGNILHVSKDCVRDEHGKWVVKPPKTKDSVRDVVLPDWVVSEMPKEGRLVSTSPSYITTSFSRIMKELDIPGFRFHDLRKHAVSLMAATGVSMASIKKLGGWSNMNTPQQIYIKALSDAHFRELSGYLEYISSLKE